MSGKITILDVAKYSKVSTATVSRVINGSPIPTPETRRKVLDAVERLNYTPNLIASNLRGHSADRDARKTGDIGFLLYNLDKSAFFYNDFYHRIFIGLERTVAEKGKHLIVANIQEDELLPRMVRDMKVDGVIVEGPVPREIVVRIAEYIPVVLLNYHIATSKASSVMPDNRQGVYLAMKHLRELGHEKIAFVGEGERNLHFKERLAGYLEASAELEMDIREEYSDFQTSVDVAASARENVKLFLELKDKRPTAVVFINDFHALGFLKEASRRGIRVPDDVSLIGFDNIVPGANSEPSLTTINIPLEEMGKLAVEILMKNISGEERIRKKVVLDTNLVVRRSCAAI